jgi:alkylhydroperoxidase/carboxymuconolactone decarboxylase family protein YurZ
MVDEEDLARGADMMQQVYGFRPDGWERTPLSVHTIGELFGGVWSRPGLSVRDRRLMVIGIAASLGRSDLIEVQLLGALRNGEIEPPQVEEIVLHLAYYVGWPQTSPIQQGADAALGTYAAEQEKTREEQQ